MSEQTPPENGGRPQRRPWALPLAVAVLVAVLAGLYFFYPVIVPRSGGGTAKLPTPTPRSTPKVSPQATPTPTKPKPPPPKPPKPVTSGLKTPIAGLLDRKGPPSSAYYSVIDGYVVNVDWASLQVVPGAPIPNGNAIDRAIAQVRQANAAGAHLALKVRVFTGIAAPSWAKNIGGPPVRVRDPQANVTGTVGRFWLPAFGQAYQDLENKLAARYDGVAEIREVTISRCMTVYAEPFIRDIQDPATVASLVAAGFTAAADHTCLKQQILAHAVWRHTRSDLSFNPYQEIISKTQVAIDKTFTNQMMSLCRSTLGRRCVIENNSIRSPIQNPIFYTQIRFMGPPTSFQTATFVRIGSLPGTLALAAGYGASSVELPSGYTSLFPPSSLASLRLRLKSNRSGA